MLPLIISHLLTCWRLPRSCCHARALLQPNLLPFLSLSLCDVYCEMIPKQRQSVMFNDFFISRVYYNAAVWRTMQILLLILCKNVMCFCVCLYLYVHGCKCVSVCVRACAVHTHTCVDVTKCYYTIIIQFDHIWQNGICKIH